MAPGTTKTATDKINLLTNQGESKQKKIINKVTRTSLAVLFVYVFLILVLAGLQIFVGRKKAEVDSTQQALVQDISKLGKIEGLVQAAKNRAGLAKTIISDSPSSPGKLLDDVVTSLPSSVSATSADTEGGGIKLSLKAQDSEAVTKLIEVLKSKQFATVDLESISLGTSGNYNISLRIK
ncbi:MAG: hypothetical protein HYU80_03420 [Candidatus Blackburnbacteria bacterium]|nr:hypothetical protein [Candidatus Blackburnbacteria bacterium]